MTAAPAPVLARIAITQDEWAMLRKAAIDEDTTTSKLLAKIVRASGYTKGGNK